MKKSIFLFLVIFVFTFVGNAQNDTMYVMKNGHVVGKYNVNTEVDSIIFYRPEEVSSVFVDERDGNSYYCVTIDGKVWMAENLKYLPEVYEPTNGSSDEARYYVHSYNGSDLEEALNTENYNTYGVLYNWYAATNGEGTSNSNPSNVQGVCPEGWHLPSFSEWQDLVEYAGGELNAGGKLKGTGTEYWNAPNTGATDEFGFNGLPGGDRGVFGSYFDLGIYGYWWTSTQHFDLTESAWCPFMHNTDTRLLINNYDKSYGFSVRCVKD